MKRSYWKFLCPVLVPFFYLVLAIQWGHSAKARIISRDATYYYLLNAYSVAVGEAIHLDAHPGIPLQILGGAVVFFKHKTFPESELPVRDELVEYHEQYLQWLAMFAILVNSAALAFAGFRAMRRLSSAEVILVQCSFFLVPSVWTYSGLYQPETLLITCGSLLWIGFYLRRKNIFWHSLIMGSILSIKMNFIAYLASHFVARPKKRIFLGLFMAIASFMAWCLFLIPEWPRMKDWYFDLAVHQGDYNTGSVGLPNFEKVGAVLHLQFGEINFAVPYLVISIIYLFGVGLFTRGNRRLKRLFCGSFFIFVASFFIYLMKPTHSYYVFPTLGVVPAFLSLYFQLMRRSILRKGAAVLLILPSLLWHRDYIRYFGSSIPDQQSTYESGRRLENLLRSEADCKTTLLAGMIPLGISAVGMGALYTDSKWLHFLDAKYPHLYFQDYRAIVNRFSRSEISSVNLLINNTPGCILFVNSNLAEELGEIYFENATKIRRIYADQDLEVHRLDYAKKVQLVD